MDRERPSGPSPRSKRAVDAATTCLRTPRPRACQDVLDTVGTPAERAVFIDDIPHNVCGARAVGIRRSGVRDPVVGFDRTARIAGPRRAPATASPDRMRPVVLPP
ncbi:hypothetical protein ACWEQU_03985 [Streptomyces nodosus]